MPTVGARTHSTLRWTLLAGASMIVLTGVLGPSSVEAQTTNTVSSSVTSIQTVTSGNSLSITSTGILAPTSGAGISIPGSTTIGSVWSNGSIVSTNANAISPGIGVSIVGIHNTGYISATSNVLQSASNARIGTITNSGTILGNITDLRTGGLTITGGTGTITNTGVLYGQRDTTHLAPTASQPARRCRSAASPPPATGI